MTLQVTYGVAGGGGGGGGGLTGLTLGRGGNPALREFGSSIGTV